MSRKKYPKTFPCKGCGRTLRSQTTRSQEYPGVPKVDRWGMCYPCSHPKEAVPATLPCEGGCGKTLRRNGLLAKDYPGTQVVVARRRCHRCYASGDFAGDTGPMATTYSEPEEDWIRTHVPNDLTMYFGLETQ